MNIRDIPVVILAGGRGARFDHESQVRPKPMIEVVGKPILQHIIDGLVRQGFREFIIATGYLGGSISEYFLRQMQRVYCYGDIWSDRMRAQGQSFFGLGDSVTVRCVETGHDSHTGERLWCIREHIGDRRFVLTYGDGLSDVNMAAVIDQHVRTGAGVTMTVVHPPGRFGVVEFPRLEYGHLVGDVPHDPPLTQVISFAEKPADSWINGGFMVCEPQFITRYIEEDNELERTALNELASDGGLHGYRHMGYWHCMDTRRDLEQIEQDVRDNGDRPLW